MVRIKFFAAIYLFLLGISLIALNYYIVADGDIKYQVVAVDESNIKGSSGVETDEPVEDWWNDWDDFKDEWDEWADDWDDWVDGRHHNPHDNHHHDHGKHHHDEKGHHDDSDSDDDHSGLSAAGIILSIVAFVALCTICWCYVSCANNLFNAVVRQDMLISSNAPALPPQGYYMAPA